MTAADIAKGLRKPRKISDGWMVCCPGHNDQDPSLHLTDAGEKVLVKCHAGCEQAAVVDALKGLGLWPKREKPAGRRIVAEYNYTDERGSLLYQVLRYEPKGFSQRRPDGNGGWLSSLGDVRRVPYRLPELVEAAIVFIAEGERDCEALRSFGFCATCNSGGAGKWRPEFTPFFSGKEVIILPDNDPPGWRHALDIARHLAGTAAKIQLIELPGAKDAAEWFERGHSELELIELVEAPCLQ
jgi:putative DNA primase/helicase